jgi:predicted transcriptional regulator
MADIKQQVLKMIETLPDEITIDDIMAELYLKMQVDAGLQELDDGKGLSHEVAKEKLSKWLLK